MYKLKCIAIDDEPFALEMISEDIAKIPYLELTGKFSSAMKAQGFLEQVDLIFLDIQMPNLSGIVFLKSLKKPPLVILTTAYEQYALEGFDLKVVDYLLKPIPFDRFLKATDYAKELFLLKKQKAVGSDFIIVYAEYKQIKIFSSEIVFIEGLKDYVKIYLVNQEKPILTRMNLKGILNRLSEKDFCRVHNSFIVAINHVQSFQKNCIFISKTKIPIGTKYLNDFIQIMNKIHQ